MVLQDSYHKDIRIDLPGIVGEMTIGKGWVENSRVDFLLSGTMADINTAARAYPKARSSAESVITFQKPN